MVNGITPTSFQGLGLSLSIVNQSRMSLPVAPADYIYAHFEHVSGTPAPEGVQGVPINRLKILDTLISQLQQIKKNPVVTSAPSDPISNLVNQIRQAVAAHNTMPYLPNPSAPSGAVLNLSL